MMTREKLQQVLEQAQYQYARTMPKTPHWYTKRQTWTDDDLFREVVEAIRAYAEKRRWGRGYERYFDAGIYQYWTGFESPQRCPWINRAVRPGLVIEGNYVTDEEGIRHHLRFGSGREPQPDGQEHPLFS